jgi:ABC-type multidrug transport system ATPase subunit
MHTMFDEILQINTKEEIFYHASDQIMNDLTLDVNDNDQQINYSNINVIASEPNSNLIDNYKSYAEEQLKDEDIQWIKHLIINNPIDKPIINQFKTNIKKFFIGNIIISILLIMFYIE